MISSPSSIVDPREQVDLVVIEFTALCLEMLLQRRFPFCYQKTIGAESRNPLLKASPFQKLVCVCLNQVCFPFHPKSLSFFPSNIVEIVRRGWRVGIRVGLAQNPAYPALRITCEQYDKALLRINKINIKKKKNLSHIFNNKRGASCWVGSTQVPHGKDKENLSWI